PVRNSVHAAEGTPGQPPVRLALRQGEGAQRARTAPGRLGVTLRRAGVLQVGGADAADGMALGEGGPRARRAAPPVGQWRGGPPGGAVGGRPREGKAAPISMTGAPPGWGGTRRSARPTGGRSWWGTYPSGRSRFRTNWDGASSPRRGRTCRFRAWTSRSTGS